MVVLHQALWRFTGVSFLFTCASALVALSSWAGTSNMQIVTVGVPESHIALAI